MLVKDYYFLPCSNFDLLELPDGTLYKFNVVPARTLTEADLLPVDLHVPKSVYLASCHAVPYAPGFQSKIFGLTFCH